MTNEQFAKMSPAEQQALIAEMSRIRAENEALKAAAVKKLTLKVGEKGGVSLYGMGQFPVTLYVEQWERLIGHIPAIQAFIEENRPKLKTKAQASLEAAKK